MQSSLCTEFRARGILFGGKANNCYCGKYDPRTCDRDNDAWHQYALDTNCDKKFVYKMVRTENCDHHGYNPILTAAKCKEAAAAFDLQYNSFSTNNSPQGHLPQGCYLYKDTDLELIPQGSGDVWSTMKLLCETAVPNIECDGTAECVCGRRQCNIGQICDNDKCSCPTGYAGDNCQDCDAGYTGENCDQCTDGYYRVGTICTQCRDTCPAGQYETTACTLTSNRVCKQCRTHVQQGSMNILRAHPQAIECAHSVVTHVQQGSMNLQRAHPQAIERVPPKSAYALME